jgi:preprotein translocase subunit SecG
LITLVTILHVLVCIFLILIILLQAGKGGGMGAAFGGAGAQTVFGGRGAQTFLGKVTSVAAGVFMLTSLTLSYISTRAGSVVKEGQVVAPAPQPGSSPFQPPAPGAPARPASGPAQPTVPGPAVPPAPTPAR